jgi:predicted secreted protein
MAELSGKQGKITYKAGQVAAFGGWTMDVNTNMLDVTTFSTGTLQWRDFITGLSDWSGSIDGNFDVASTGLDDIRVNVLTPATGTLQLYMDKVGGEHFSGQVWWQTMGHTADIDGKVEVSLGLQGTGTLTYATTT